MRLSKHRSGPQHGSLGQKMTGPIRMHRRVASANCFLTISLVILCTWHGKASGAAETTILAAVEPDDNRTNGLGDWIWTAQTLDRQTCQFWRSFEVPRGAAVVRARLRMTV